MDPVPVARARKLLIFAVVGVHVGLAFLLAFSTIRLDPFSTLICYILAVPFVLGLVAARWRRLVPIYVPLETLIAGLWLTAPVVTSTYLAISLNQPLADNMLIAMDRAIGFDWLAFIAFVDARPTLAVLLGYAYSSFIVQLLLLPPYLAFARQPTRAYAMVFGYLLLTMLASFISIWFPAHGGYPVYGIPAEDMANISAYYGYAFLEQFEAVRNQTDFVLDFGGAAGILTFPSVHAAVAALCAWAAWPSRILRYPLLAVNIAMCVSAVTHGSHYLIDVIAGVGLTAFCIAVTQALFFRPQAGRRSPILDGIETSVRVLGLRQRATP